jgi:hypothetical protein
MAMGDTPAAIAEEIERRKAVALEAEQRYYDAIDTEDPAQSSAKRAAASAWIWALDALNDFRRMHVYPNPDNRRPGINGRLGLSESGAAAP